MNPIIRQNLPQLVTLAVAALCFVVGASALAADEDIVRPQLITPCSSAAACQAWADNGWCERYVGYIYTSVGGKGVGCIRVCESATWTRLFRKARLYYHSAACS